MAATLRSHAGVVAHAVGSHSRLYHSRWLPCISLSCAVPADLPMTAAAYSHDGSVLAVGSRSSVTLWQPEANARMATLVAPACHDTSTCTHVAFLAGGAHMVSAHRGKRGCLVVWNLLTLTSWWCIFTAVEDIAPHPSLPCFAAIIDEPKLHASTVVVMGPDSDQAQETWRSRRGARVARAMFVPQGCALHSRLCSGKALGVADGRGPLFVMTQDRRIVMIPDNSTSRKAAADGAIGGRKGLASDTQQSDATEQHEHREGGAHGRPAEAREAAGAATQVSGFRAMYGEAPAAKIRDARDAADAPALPAPDAASDLSAVFDAPSHLLPPAEELCHDVLRLLLRKPCDAG
jgi:hypothetical protein